MEMSAAFELLYDSCGLGRSTKWVYRVIENTFQHKHRWVAQKLKTFPLFHSRTVVTGATDGIGKEYAHQVSWTSIFEGLESRRLFDIRVFATTIEEARETTRKCTTMMLFFSDMARGRIGEHYTSTRFNCLPFVPVTKLQLLLGKWLGGRRVIDFRNQQSSLSVTSLLDAAYDLMGDLSASTLTERWSIKRCTHSTPAL